MEKVFVTGAAGSLAAILLTACLPAANTSSAGTIFPPASGNLSSRRWPIRSSSLSKAITSTCPRSPARWPDAILSSSRANADVGHLEHPDRLQQNDPCHRAGERGQVEVIAFDKLELRMGQRRLDKFPLAGGKIVPADDVFAAGKQAVNKIAAMKPAAPVTKTFSMIGREV